VRGLTFGIISTLVSYVTAVMIMLPGD